MLDTLNQNSGAVTGLATIALLIVTAAYAWITWLLLRETRFARTLAGEPRVVAYLRVHPVHGNLVQLHIANLAGAAATEVTAAIDKLTEWPEQFDLQDSKILRDLSFMRPHEVLTFDLGGGPDLFRNEQAARFRLVVRFRALDGRPFTFERELKVESVEGFGQWQIYTIDDVARRLKDIADTLKGFAGFRRMRVETLTAQDRRNENDARERQRERMRQRDNPTNDTSAEKGGAP